MQCPRCQAAMTRGKRKWFCEECELSLPLECGAAVTPIWEGVDLARLPSVLAIPLKELAEEPHAVVRLHRLSDAVEIITRFCTMVAIGELRRAAGDGPFPEAFQGKLRGRAMYTPTFDRWRDLLRAAVADLPPVAARVVPGLQEFVEEALMPVLEGAPATPHPERNLIKLRNNLVHGGAMTWSEANRLFGLWIPRIKDLARRLGFLGQSHVCQLELGKAWLLQGPMPSRVELPLPPGLEQLAAERNGKVVMLHGESWVDLWPLCGFGQARVISLDGERRAVEAGPLVYYRAENDRLLYAALGVELPLSEESDTELLRGFESLFRVEERRKGGAGETVADCNDDLETAAREFRGRGDELRQLLDRLITGEPGVLWLTGPGGIGKSCLAAKAAQQLRKSRRAGLRLVYWRFKTSDLARCNRAAFLRHAVSRLSTGLGRVPLVPGLDPAELERELVELLGAAAEASRVVLVLDGVDEITRIDPGFAKMVRAIDNERFPNVVWMCVGREEGELGELFRPGPRCQHAFRDGLPPMSAADVRVMIQTGPDKLRWELVRRDLETGTQPGAIRNDVVEAVVRQANGFPLYVSLFLRDVIEGQLRLEDALGNRLPPSLGAFYDRLLHRLGVSDVQALLPRLLVGLAWAVEPLDEPALLALLQRLGALPGGETGRELLTRGLRSLNNMVRRVGTPEGKLGYELVHDTLRAHIQTDSSQLRCTHEMVRREWAAVIRDWREARRSGRAWGYVLRSGPSALLELGATDEAAELLLDLEYLEARVNEGQVFGLMADLSRVVQALGETDRRRRWLDLLSRGILRDIHFVHDHREDYPQGLFQCLWNSCWWVDGTTPAEPGTDDYRICGLLERWRAQREASYPGLRWLRSLRPPSSPLSAGHQAVFRRKHGAVHAVAWSPDGRHVASGHEDGTVIVWTVQNGEVRLVLPAHEGRVNGVTWSTDGSWLATGGQDWRICRWDADTGDLLGSPVLPPEPPATTDLEPLPHERPQEPLPPGQTDPGNSRTDAAEIDCDPSDDWFDVPERFMSLTAAAARADSEWSWRQGITRLAVSGDGRFLASGGGNGCIEVWDLEKRESVSWRTSHDFDEVSGLCFAPDARLLAVGETDGSVSAWDWASQAEVQSEREHTRRVSVAFLDDGRRLASAGEVTIRIVDLGTGEPSHVLGEPGVRGGAAIYCHTCVAASPDGRHLATGSQRGVALWDAQSGALEMVLGDHEGRVNDLAFAPDGRSLAAALQEGSVQVWSLDTRREPAEGVNHEGRIHSLAFSSDGSRLASGDDRGSVRVWDVARGVPVLELSTGWQQRNLFGGGEVVETLRFSNDGKWLAASSFWTPRNESPDIWDYWDLDTGARVGTCGGFGGGTHGTIPKVEFEYRRRPAIRLQPSEGEMRLVCRPGVGRFAPIDGPEWFALLPHELDVYDTDTDGRTWAGSVENRLELYRLEGAEVEPPAPAGSRPDPGDEDIPF